MAKTVRIDAATATLMARLGRLLQRLPAKTTVAAFITSAEYEEKFGALGPQHENTARLLRQASVAFGDNLEKYLRQFGPARVYLLAKFDRGPKIAKSGRIKVPGDRAPTALVKVSVKELERALQGESRVSDAEGGLARLPGGLFVVPDDLDQAYEFLHARLKSLARWDQEVVPRFRLDQMDSKVRSRLRRLEALLKLYLRLVRYFRRLGGDDGGERRQVSGKGEGKTAGARYVKGRFTSSTSVVEIPLDRPYFLERSVSAPA